MGICAFVHMYICTYIYSYVYMYIHMKSSFPKRGKRQSKNRVYNANAKFSDCILETITA